MINFRLLTNASYFMLNFLIFIALLSFVLGLAFHYWLSNFVLPYRHLSYVWLFSLRNHQKYGQPCATDKVLKRKGYALGFSFKHKTALWASYIISKASVGVDMERGENFLPDTEVPQNCRVVPQDYSNTNYDRGHLVPSASVDYSRESNDETFLMTNIALQDPKLNRQAWSSLEELTRRWTYSKGRLYVVVGPVFDKKPEEINGIALPKGFYMVIYAMNFKKAIAFLMPNKALVASKIWEHAVSVKEVEKQTGLTFFSKMRKSTQNQLKEQLDLNWWKQH